MYATSACINIHVHIFSIKQYRIISEKTHDQKKWAATLLYSLSLGQINPRQITVVDLNFRQTTGVDPEEDGGVAHIAPNSLKSPLNWPK